MIDGSGNHMQLSENQFPAPHNGVQEKTITGLEPVEETELEASKRVVQPFTHDKTNDIEKYPINSECTQPNDAEDPPSMQDLQYAAGFGWKVDESSVKEEAYHVPLSELNDPAKKPTLQDQQYAAGYGWKSAADTEQSQFKQVPLTPGWDYIDADAPVNSDSTQYQQYDAGFGWDIDQASKESVQQSFDMDISEVNDPNSNPTMQDSQYNAGFGWKGSAVEGNTQKKQIEMTPGWDYIQNGKEQEGPTTQYQQYENIYGAGNANTQQEAQYQLPNPPKKVSKKQDLQPEKEKLHKRTNKVQTPFANSGRGAKKQKGGKNTLIAAACVCVILVGTAGGIGIKHITDSFGQNIVLEDTHSKLEDQLPTKEEKPQDMQQATPDDDKVHQETSEKQYSHIDAQALEEKTPTDLAAWYISNFSAPGTSDQMAQKEFEEWYREACDEDPELKGGYESAMDYITGNEDMMKVLLGEKYQDNDPVPEEEYQPEDEPETAPEPTVPAETEQVPESPPPVYIDYYPNIDEQMLNRMSEAEVANWVVAHINGAEEDYGQMVVKQEFFLWLETRGTAFAEKVKGLLELMGWPLY